MIVVLIYQGAASRPWRVNQAEIDVGDRLGTATSDARRLGELERQVRELRRANAILRSAGDGLWWRLNAHP